MPPSADHVEMLIPPLPWDRRAHVRDTGTEGKVVLLHGLGRSWHAMNPLARRLNAEGFSTLNIPYPSLTKPVDWILSHLRDRISSFAREEPVHFIGHSLGGILVRTLLAEEATWKPGRFIMLAPPNGGSEIIDWASRKLILRALLSPAARALSSDGIPSRLPSLPQDLEAMVIMGRRSSIPFFRKILSEGNDGIVSVTRGRIDGLKAFAVVDADHTFIQIHPETVRRTLEFLRTGNSAD